MNDNETQEGHKMEEHKYRGQLIRVVATKTPGTEYCAARADIRYQDRKGLRFFPLEGPRSKFTTKEAAQKNIIKEAEKCVDRLDSAVNYSSTRGDRTDQGENNP